MAIPSQNGSPPLPTWLLAAGSLLLVIHVGILGISVLAEQSGPWWTPYGRDTSLAPQFARSVDAITRPNYLRPLKMTHTYHFMTNRSELPGVRFEVKLRNASGELIETLRFPNPDANPWVRHRQGLLAWNLLSDQPAQPQGGEVIPAPGQQRVKVPIWEVGMDRVARLRPTEEHLIPRDRPVERPSELSLTLAASYTRYLRRIHGAASAEVVRHSRYPFSPVVLFQPELPPGAADELVASFGEMTW